MIYPALCEIYLNAKPLVDSFRNVYDINDLETKSGFKPQWLRRLVSVSVVRYLLTLPWFKIHRGGLFHVYQIYQTSSVRTTGRLTALNSRLNCTKTVRLDFGAQLLESVRRLIENSYRIIKDYSMAFCNTRLFTEMALYLAEFRCHESGFELWVKAGEAYVPSKQITGRVKTDTNK